MAMKSTRDFWQYGLEAGYLEDTGSKEKPQGVCFRESFKWLACQVYGLPFKFEDSKAEKVMRKQADYLKAVAPYEGPKASFASFFTNVHRISQQTLNEWGTKDSRKTGAAKYRLKFGARVVFFTLSGCKALEADGSMIIGMYGKAGSQGPWAHAVALHRRGGKPVYFDPNGGEYEFGPGDRIGAVLMNHYRTRTGPYIGEEGGVTYTIERFGLYPVLAS